MAESILKLRVDSQEYDNKIKRATEGLQAYAEGCRKAGGTLTQLDEGVLEFTKALGSMDTVSKSARGSVSEMTKAFTELSVQYNKLTDEEKASPFGQALATSLDQLKGRIQDGNGELKNIGNTLNNTGGILGQLKDKFTINIDAVKLFNTGVTAAKAALDVAKDAFFASEANVDEWGRTMKSAEGLYQGFLTAINTGDISGYLNRMDEIVKAAREAYNAMDTLQTMKTIQSPQFSKQEAENNRLRTMLMTGRYIAPGAGSGMKAVPGMKSGDLLSPAQLKRIEVMLSNGMKTIVSLTENEVTQTGVAINKYYDNLAKQNGMTMAEFQEGTKNWAEFSKRANDYQKYLEFEQKHTSAVTMQSSTGAYTQMVRDGIANPYEYARKWGVFRVDKMGENSYNDLVNLIKQQQSQQSQMYSTLGQAYRTINRAEGVTVKNLMNGGGGSGSGGSGGGGGATGPTYAPDSIAAQQALVQELTKLWNESGSAVRESYLQQLVEAEAKLKEMKKEQELLKLQAEGKFNAPKLWQGDIDDMIGNTKGTTNLSGTIIQSVDDIREYLNKNPIKVPIEAAEDKVNALKVAAQNTAQVVGTIGQAFNAIENPAAKVAGIVAQAIANVALAYSDNLAKDQPSKYNIWSFIAAAAASTISMMTTIASIHKATGYASGGMIKGNSYSGDNMMAMGPQGLVGLNAGEIVLNRAQSGVIANALQSEGTNRGFRPSYVSGEQIWIALNAYSKRTGKGEIVTWR